MKEQFKNIAKGFFPYFATPAMIVFLIWNYATDKERSKNVQFDDSKQKYKVVTFVEDSPTPKQQQQQYILDSINTVSAIKSRKKRDEANRINDSINRLNADQIFQTKEAIKKINKKLNIE